MSPLRLLIPLSLSLMLGCGGGGESAPELVAKAPAAKAGPAGDSAAGKTVYSANCVACHQADGKGMGGALGADFVGDATRKAKSDAELIASVASGMEGTTMVAWSGILDDTQIRDVVAYIRTEFMK